jgi:hypothetical protein
MQQDVSINSKTNTQNSRNKFLRILTIFKKPRHCRGFFLLQNVFISVKNVSLTCLYKVSVGVDNRKIISLALSLYLLFVFILVDLKILN